MGSGIGVRLGKLRRYFDRAWKARGYKQGSMYVRALIARDAYKLWPDELQEIERVTAEVDSYGIGHSRRKARKAVNSRKRSKPEDRQVFDK